MVTTKKKKKVIKGWLPTKMVASGSNSLATARKKYPIDNYFRKEGERRYYETFQAKKWNGATMWRPQYKTYIGWKQKKKVFLFLENQIAWKNSPVLFITIILDRWWPIKCLSGVRLDRWPVPKIPITCGGNPWRADTISILPPSFALLHTGSLFPNLILNTNLCWTAEWDCN